MIAAQRAFVTAKAARDSLDTSLEDIDCDIARLDNECNDAMGVDGDGPQITDLSEHDEETANLRMKMETLQEQVSQLTAQPERKSGASPVKHVISTPPPKGKREDSMTPSDASVVCVADSPTSRACSLPAAAMPFMPSQAPSECTPPSAKSATPEDSYGKGQGRGAVAASPYSAAVSEKPSDQTALFPTGAVSPGEAR